MKPRRESSQILEAGVALSRAEALVVLVHGRGATASGMLDLIPAIDSAGVAYRAPQAAAGSWYPLSFLAPTAENEPALSSSLEVVGQILTLAEDAGIPRRRQVLLGFSQGACLVLEQVARDPRPLGGVVAFTGGTLGPLGTIRQPSGDLEGTPIFIGSSDPDLHVPWNRVQESANLFETMGAQVTLRRYPGMPHTIHPDELQAAGEIVARAAMGSRARALSL